MTNPTGTDGSVTMVLGGASSLVDTSSTERGVHAQYPAAQLKYFTSWDKAKQSMARLFVPFTSDSDRTAFVNTFQDKETQKYVKALASTGGYIDFLLHQANESVEEKTQVIELLNDTYVAYFFGQKAPVFQYSGTLFTTVQDDHWRGFTLLYTNLLRGSKLADAGKLVSLRYDSRIITGALMNFTGGLTSEQQMAVPFSFNLLVKRVDIVPPLKSVTDPTWIAQPTVATGQAAAGLSDGLLKTLSSAGVVLGSTQITGTVSDTGVPTKATAPTEPAPDTTKKATEAATPDALVSGVPTTNTYQPSAPSPTSTFSVLDTITGNILPFFGGG